MDLLWFIMGIIVSASIFSLWIFFLVYHGFIKIEWVDRSIKME